MRVREETRRKKNIYNKLSIHQFRRSPVKAPFLGRHNHQQTLASLYHNITFKREIHSFLTSAIRWLPVGQRGRERPPKFTWSSFQNFTLDRQTSGHCWLFSRQLKRLCIDQHSHLSWDFSASPSTGGAAPKFLPRRRRRCWRQRCNCLLCKSSTRCGSELGDRKKVDRPVVNRHTRTSTSSSSTSYWHKFRFFITHFLFRPSARGRRNNSRIS